jgi:hypothetical protein
VAEGVGVDMRKAVMSKPNLSRPVRWQLACSRAILLAGELEEALSDLVDLQSEYEEWADNLPDGLRDSPVAEKLEAVVSLDLEGACSSAAEIQGIANEAEDVELPRGFGRD